MSNPNWFILDCEYGYEEHVGLHLHDAQVQFYIPMVSVEIKSGRHAPKRYGMEIPLLPGLIFLNSSPYAYVDIPKVNHLWCNAYGVADVVPDWQMVRFKRVVSDYLQLCRDNIAKGKVMPPKPKALRFKLGDPAARGAMLERLGVNSESEAA